MEQLRFKNYNDLKKFIDSLDYIGEGVDGVVYLLDNKWSIKIFHGWRTSAEDILPFLNLKIEGFAFPVSIIYMGDSIVGIVTPFILGKDINKEKLATKKISDVITASNELIPSIGELSYAHIIACDTDECNIIYGNKKLTVIDTLQFEFNCSRPIFEKNIERIMVPVIDSSLDIKNSNINTFFERIHSRYIAYSYDTNLLQNPRELLLGVKGELEEFIEMPIETFSDAKGHLQRKLIKR